MKKAIRILIVYFPVMLVTAQVLVNLLSFVFPKVYYTTGFYLNTFFGTNVFFALFLVAFTFTLRFCRVSRYAAIAELMFAVNFMIVKEDNLYNILFQVIVGMTALAYTFKHYIDKFPLCRMSLVISFIKSVVKKRSCSKGLDDWDRKVKELLLKKHYER